MLTGCSLTCFIIVYKYIFYRVDDLWITIYMAWNELKLKLMLLLELNKLSTSVSIESLAVYATVAFVTYWFTRYINKQQLNKISINNHLRQQLNTSPE